MPSESANPRLPSRGSSRTPNPKTHRNPSLDGSTPCSEENRGLADSDNDDGDGREHIVLRGKHGISWFRRWWCGQGEGNENEKSRSSPFVLFPVNKSAMTSQLIVLSIPLGSQTILLMYTKKIFHLISKVLLEQTNILCCFIFSHVNGIRYELFDPTF